jgi:hypothetical protein
MSDVNFTLVKEKVRSFCTKKQLSTKKRIVDAFNQSQNS